MSRLFFSSFEQIKRLRVCKLTFVAIVVIDDVAVKMCNLKERFSQNLFDWCFISWAILYADYCNAFDTALRKVFKLHLQGIRNSSRDIE